MSIQRYKETYDPDMRKDEAGDYVTYEDHAATIATLTAERDQARAAILAFGGGNDFDWNVLDEIDQLRKELAEAKAVVEKVAVLEKAVSHLQHLCLLAEGGVIPTWSVVWDNARKSLAAIAWAEAKKGTQP